MQDRAGGPFEVRPTVRAELRAPVAGFLEEVRCEEGDRVTPGMQVARLHVPDLASRIAQKQAEVREAQARLRLLEAGARYEEVLDKRRRIQRAEAWRDLARSDLGRARLVLAEDLKRLEEQIRQSTAELSAAEGSLARARRLQAGRSLSAEDHAEALRRYRVFKAQVEQAFALKKSRQLLGAQEAEAELARRDKELAEARGALSLLEAGSRPEEIEADRARLDRLREETCCLQRVQARLLLSSPVSGLITTPHLKEKVAQYVHEGDLIAVVEEPTALEAEVALPEEEMAQVQIGQVVSLKARALPFDTFAARVKRIAPSARPDNARRTVTLSCELEIADGTLRPGMTGHARVFTGPQSVATVLLRKALRYIRTEFWW
jgi:HlyD family secretion protein